MKYLVGIIIVAALGYIFGVKDVMDIKEINGQTYKCINVKDNSLKVNIDTNKEIKEISEKMIQIDNNICIKVDKLSIYQNLKLIINK